MIKKRIFKLKDGRVLQPSAPTIQDPTDSNKFYYTSFGNFFPDLKEIGDRQIFSDDSYIEVYRKSPNTSWGVEIVGCACYDKKGVKYPDSEFDIFGKYLDTGLDAINSIMLMGVNGVNENDFILNKSMHTPEGETTPIPAWGMLMAYTPLLFTAYPSPANYYQIGGSTSYNLRLTSVNKEDGQSGEGLWRFLMEDIPEEWEYIGQNTGEPSEEGGQNGSFDDSSDNINIPDLPSVGASNCGLVNMYELTVQQLRSFSDFLWSNITEVSENLKKLFSDPMDSIISLSLTPINPSTTTSAEIKIGNISTGVTGQIVTNQYLTIDCGEIEIKTYWDNFLDYSPYTKLSIYLPFIGTQVLNIDDFMNRKIGVKYNIDLLSGSCACFVSADSTVLYQYSGNVISQIPISGKNSLELYKAVISGIVNTGLAIGTGGASIGAQSIATLASSGMNVMNGKEIIQRGGQITGTNSLLSVKYPFITIIRASQSLPEKFNSLKGYPSNITIKLGDLSGYTEIAYIHLDGIDALDSEKEEIERLLKDGVIF